MEARAPGCSDTSKGCSIMGAAVRGMGWARGTCEGYRNAYEALWRNLRESDRLGDQGIDGRKY